MSVHLLRHGVRTCRLTIPRLLSSARRSYPAQATQALSDALPNDTLSELQPPTSSTAEPPAEVEKTASPSIARTPQKAKSRSKRSSKKAKEQEPATPTRDPFQPTRVDLYLASLQASGVDPTLQDIERCKPPVVPNAFSKTYPEEYNALVDTLCRSFSKEQLRNFIELYRLPRSLSRPRRKKIEYAETIIEQQWKWPSLKAVEKAKRDRTEVATELLPVQPSQLFVMLGPDGVDMLRLSLKYNVHISLVPSSLSLRIEGVRGALQLVLERLAEIKKEIVEETFQLPGNAPIPSELVPRISRLAGAYIENIGSDGLIRLCARSAHELNGAKRLATRAITEVHATPSPPLLAYLPVGEPSVEEVPTAMFPHTYALYPFLSSRELPWYVNTTGAFRVRRVGEWLDQRHKEDISVTGGLAGDKGRILDIEHNAVSLRDTLLATTSTLDGSTRQVKATLGHFLYTTTGARSTLIPPLQGSYQFNKILDWIKNHKTRSTFIPSLPACLVNSAPLYQRLVHRLVYRALPNSNSSEVQNTDSADVILSTAENIYFELVLAQLKQEASETSDTEGDSAEVPKLSLIPHCWQSRETKLDLILPDRPIDARFTLAENLDFPVDMEPSDLQSYAVTLQNFLSNTDEKAVQPDPPLMVYHSGRTYVLHTSATIRQSVENVNVPDSNEAAQKTVQVNSESALDLESNKRATLSEVICSDLGSDESWTQFLKTCDVLSAASYKPFRASSLSNSEVVPL